MRGKLVITHIDSFNNKPVYWNNTGLNGWDMDHTYAYVFRSQVEADNILQQVKTKTPTAYVEMFIYE